MKISKITWIWRKIPKIKKIAQTDSYVASTLVTGHIKNNISAESRSMLEGVNLLLQICFITRKFFLVNEITADKIKEVLHKLTETRAGYDGILSILSTFTLESGWKIREMEGELSTNVTWCRSEKWKSGSWFFIKTSNLKIIIEKTQ